MLLYCVWLNIKARLQYGRSYLYEMLTAIIAYMFEFFAVWIIVNKFMSIAGWSFYEILLLHALGYFVRATASAFLWQAVWSQSDYIQSGEMDSYLIRPTNPFLYLIGRTFMTYAISHVLFGGIVTVVMLFLVPIQWTVLKGLLFLLAVIGGITLYGSLIIFAGAISFWTIRSTFFLRMLTQAWNMINYPLTIYPRALQLVLTFFIPLAVLNYYQSGFLLDKGVADNITMIVIFVVGCTLCWLAYQFWMFGLKKYQSVGN